MKCLENLKNCKASCCKLVVFHQGIITEDMRKYLRYHGFKVEPTANREWKIYVPARCEKLTEDYKCSLHGTDKKPKCCVDFDEKSKKKYNVTEGCILK